MKNFSEATVTSTDLKVVIDIKPVGAPLITVKIANETLFNGLVESSLRLEHYHDLLSPFDLSIQLYNKKYTLEYETAIVIEKIVVDKIDLIPEMSHHFRYENDHGFNDPTNYLGFNGIWKLNTRDCFYRWWHQASGQGWLLHPTR